MTQSIPIITIKGNSEERGFQHGRQLKSRIQKTVAYYKELYPVKGASYREVADYFRQQISAFNEAQATEIRAVAKAADMDELDIFALNARSEILAHNFQECTSVYFPETGILGQNWDFFQEMEELAVIIQSEDENGQKIIQLTEPGIVGKIGMNSRGLGLCLNFVAPKKNHLATVPIHSLLYSLLYATSFEEAREIMTSNSIRTSGNILLGDKHGQGINMEYAGASHWIIQSQKGTLLHTNHYLQQDDEYHQNDITNSVTRFKRAQDISGSMTGKTVSDMKKILLDRTDEQYPICRPYQEDRLIGTSGTITSIIMDLQKGKFMYTPGSPLKNSFKTVRITST